MTAPTPTIAQQAEAIRNTRERLLCLRDPAGHWEGRLATSALSTATAVLALHFTDAGAHDGLIRGGLDWLAAHPNDDGGYGDTTASLPNLNTTALCWAAFACAPEPRDEWRRAEAAAAEWLREVTGTLEPDAIVRNILAFYGRDRTFSTPILTVLALAGRLGPREEAFARIPALPFEFAAAPHNLWRFLRLPVVSYAMPSLVAIGQTRHHFAPPRCPVKRTWRNLARRRTLRVVRSMQAGSGGFLEAVPLTSFVAACLANIGHREHTVTREAVRFLHALVREDGGWPIDTCLSTWVTTLSVGALASGGPVSDALDPAARRRIVRWLLGQQWRTVHPFTHTPPGGWSWMDEDGAVPDADDTPGALLALHQLAPDAPDVRAAAARGVEWLLRLQNRDGGMPTFCRGWGKLPFDRSATDITAHAVRAWRTWRDAMPPPAARRIDAATGKALRFIRRSQRADGSWVPLWFGNEHQEQMENPVYGTARTVAALASCAAETEAMRRGCAFLRRVQHADGGWGGGPAGPASIEETALAVEALARAAEADGDAECRSAAERGAARLIEITDAGTRFAPAPIGLYFAKLWYFEKMYPVVFTLSALNRVRRLPRRDAKTRRPTTA